MTHGVAVIEPGLLPCSGTSVPWARGDSHGLAAPAPPLALGPKVVGLIWLVERGKWDTRLVGLVLAGLVLARWFGLVVEELVARLGLVGCMNGMVVLLVMLANRLVVMPRAIAELLVVAAAMLCLMTPLPTAVAVAVECTLAPFASFATLTLATLAAFATVGTFACPVTWLTAVVTSSLLLS